MKLILSLLLLGLASVASAEKGPDWWCRASLGEKTFLAFGVSQTEACGKALTACHDEDCFVESFGEW